MSLGYLSLRRFNGEERYAISSATLTIERGAASDPNRVRWAIRIETALPALATVDDTASMQRTPNLEVIVPASDDPVGRRFEVPAYNDETGECFTNLYYCEHEPVEDAIVEFLARRNTSLHVRITGRCTDPNFYDGSKPDAQLEVDAWLSGPDA